MITTQTIVEVRLVHIGDHIWRVERADTGKVMGLVMGHGREWSAKASMRAFLGSGPADGEPPGDWVPRELYAPQWPSGEKEDRLPGTYRSQRLAVAALQRYLDRNHAPAMGYGAHPEVRKA